MKHLVVKLNALNDKPENWGQRSCLLLINIWAVFSITFAACVNFEVYWSLNSRLISAIVGSLTKIALYTTL